ncbi:DinB family protein [Candidatus Leptofilum sp.]|uniref:DinB family protein n=1 Tax=Candidatus Leptofilum sp. TaxID=3241576 RepID=UPI003B5ABD26
MSDTQKLIQSFQTTTWIINKQAEGLSHEQMRLQLPFRGNCFNWVLGHIATNRDQVLILLGQVPIFSADEVALYKTGSEPVIEGATAVHSDKLLAAIQESQARIEAGLKTVSAETLAEIFNEAHQQTVAERIAGLHWHETYHTGQLEILRQLAGTNDRIIG